MSVLKIAFAAGDVGGARAILPVASLASRNGHHVIGLRHGPFSSEGSSDWTWLDQANFMDPQFWEREPDALVYATSVSDFAAVNSAKIAQNAGVPIVHVLDNWSNYAHRLQTTGGGLLVPDCYAVMDELAKADAVAEGIPEQILTVTGHPGLAELADEAQRFISSAGDNPLKVFFVSEPALADSGGCESSTWRGYDEVEVSGLAAKSLNLYADTNPGIALHVCVVPHPREIRADVADRWAHLLGKSRITWELVEPGQVRATLHGSNCVVGMTSILIYEAWLLGIAALSLQPGLRRADLAALSKREGVLFCTDIMQSQEHVEKLLGQARHARTHNTRLSEHVSAAAKILGIVAALAKPPTDDAYQEQDFSICH